MTGVMWIVQVVMDFVVACIIIPLTKMAWNVMTSEDSSTLQRLGCLVSVIFGIYLLVAMNIVGLLAGTVA